MQAETTIKNNKQNTLTTMTELLKIVSVGAIEAVPTQQGGTMNKQRVVLQQDGAYSKDGKWYNARVVGLTGNLAALDQSYVGRHAYVALTPMATTLQRDGKAPIVVQDYYVDYFQPLDL